MSDLLNQLKELAPLAAQATEGPWKYQDNEGTAGSWPDVEDRTGKSLTRVKIYDSCFTRAENASFIAAARNFLAPETIAALSAALVVPVAPENPWGNEPWEEYLERQREKARALHGNYESMQETNRVLANRLQAALNVLRGYEKWEADIISSDDAWNTRSGHPWMTDKLYDTMMDLQSDRNDVLKSAAPVTVERSQPRA